MALIAFGSAAACGGGDEPATQGRASTEATSATPENGAGKKACDLFTPADVEAFFGAPAKPTSELNHATQCGYWAPETGMAGVTLQISDGGQFSFSWASDQMRSMSDVVDVDGLGEAAVWVADMDMLVALAEDQTHVLSGAGSLDTKRALMERILGRL